MEVASCNIDRETDCLDHLPVIVHSFHGRKTTTLQCVLNTPQSLGFTSLPIHQSPHHSTVHIPTYTQRLQLCFDITSLPVVTEGHIAPVLQKGANCHFELH
jgi:hypothetical protein